MAMEGKAGSAQLLATKQIEFATSMLMRMAEEGGSKLLDFAEKAVVQGANKYTFYRFSEGTVGGNNLNMYEHGADQAGQAGTAKKYEATIDYVYASDKIRMEDLNSTTLDLKSSFVDSLTQAMKRNVDSLILAPINAAQGSVTYLDSTDNTNSKVLVMGDATATLDADANISAIIEAAVFAKTMAMDTTVDERPNVAIVVTAREYSQLFKAERILNMNYASSEMEEGKLFGCDVIKVAESVKKGWNTGTGLTAADKAYRADSDAATIGAIYFIPNGTFGAASWENDVDAKSWNMEGQDCLACRAKRSLGVVLIEPNSIIRLVYKR